MDLFEHNLAAHRRVFDGLLALQAAITAAAAVMTRTLEHGGKLMFFGNGGSACDCLHIAAKLTGRLRSERRPLSAMALHGDSAAPTAVGHGPGHAEVFARQLAALGRRGDCAIALLTSGRSPNVLRGLECARQLGLHTVALLGATAARRAWRSNTRSSCRTRTRRASGRRMSSSDTPGAARSNAA
jgi:D-sedoheptulose 7-phosphate isomerase